MIKTLCSLGSATVGVLLMTACGSSQPLGDQDISILSKGETNAASTGGYFWTYTDHNAEGNVYHATVSQVTTKSVALQPTKDSDAAHGNVLMISGQVPVEIPWTLVSTQDPTSIDQHWKGIYSDAMVPAYPAAGLGFGFQKNNAQFDGTQGGKFVGVAFDMKVIDGMPLVWTSFPMVGTDLPDPGFDDAFPAPGKDGGCIYYTSTNPPTTGYQTCFANYRKGYYDTTTGTSAFNTMAAGGTWKRYCTLFSEVGIPSWANAGTKQNTPAFDPKKILKMQWDMYQPKSGDPVKYELSIDNVQLMTAEDAKDAKNNCDPNMITAAPGSGGQG